jgi:hypothetical protein
MKAIYLLLLFGIITCATVPRDVIDIWYNYEYTLTTDLKNYDYTYYAFRIPVNYLGNMDFEIKIPQNEFQIFKIYVKQWTYQPDIDAINSYHEQGGLTPITDYSDYQEGNYYVYSYAFTAYSGAKYFSIEVEIPNRLGFSYMVVRVNLSKYHYSNIKDLTFNKDYYIDTSIFTANNKRIPYLYQIYIRIEVFDDDEMEIQLTTHAAYDKNSAFKVDVCQYVDQPTQQQVYYGNNAAKTNTSLENTSEEDGKYYYPFTTDKGIRYLSICITNNLHDLDYLYIYIYSKTGMAVAIIVVIVLVAVGLVGGAIYFILKKLGILK